MPTSDPPSGIKIHLNNGWNMATGWPTCDFLGDNVYLPPAGGDPCRACHTSPPLPASTNPHVRLYTWPCRYSPG
eukprot:2302687-Pyramimonas_sp.AAC.1